MDISFHNCSKPWSTMYIFYENGGGNSPCCHLCPPNGQFPMLTASKISMRDAWNSNEFRKIRRDIASGVPVDAACLTTCSYLIRKPAQNISKRVCPSYDNLDQEQQDNMDAANKAFANREEIAASMPLFYSIRFGWKCNMDCIICNHSFMEEHFPGTLDVDWLIAQEEAFRRALRIEVIGGEPFVIDSCLRFMKWVLNNPVLENVALLPITNGLYLDRFNRDELDRLAGIIVSMDSYGKYYKAIRRGGSWDKVSRNVDMYLERRSKNKKVYPANPTPVSISCTITHTGMPGLPDLVRWGVERGCVFQFRFAAPRAGMDTSCECPDLNPAPCKDGAWEDIFDECAAALGDEPLWAMSRRQLAGLRTTLAERVAAL